MDASFDGARFSALQAQLAPVWPTMTLRRRDEQRTLVMLSSVSMDLPLDFHPLLTAYEERYLIFVLGLVRQPNTRVIYVTSQPVLPRLLDYYLDLIPGLNRDELRSRLVTVSVGDSSPRPLTQKILERPRLIQRLRGLVGDPRHAVVLPFVTTPLEGQLALALDVPVYGPHPELAHLGTKSGSREVFAAAGIPHPRGATHMRTLDDVVTALADFATGGAPAEAVVKLDDAVSGWGNALVDMRGARDRADLEERVRQLRPENDALDAKAFLAALLAGAGVVEERIVGADFRSPSVQLRASPEGGVEILSTHDQVLGGPSGQTYHGCRFPARPEYAKTISDLAEAAAEELAKRGVIGRFSIDFVTTRSSTGWTAYAVEINLRNGGTTHPAIALLALTEGEYAPAEAHFLVDGIAKHYVATDHLHVPCLHSLTPDDVLDVIDEEGIGWDASTNSGVVFHMISGVAVAGRVGFTAIGNSPGEAQDLYDRVETTLTRVASPRPSEPASSRQEADLVIVAE